MRVLSRTSDGLKRCYNVFVPVDDVDKAMKLYLDDLSKNVSIPGFRKGKIPFRVMKMHYGKAVRSRVINEVVENSSKQIFAEEGGKKIFAQEYDVIKDDDKGIEYALRFELFPEFELQDFSKIKVTKYVAEVTDQEVEDIINKEREKAKNWKELGEGVTVQESHAIEVDMEAKGSVKMVGEQSLKDQMFVMGDSSLADDFWKYFIGAKVGDEVEFDISYPADTSEKGLAGKTIHYKALVKKIFEAGKFESNEEYIKSLGYKSIEEVNEVVRKNETLRRETIAREIMKRDLLDAITKMYDFDVPENLVTIEEHDVVSSIKNEAVRLGKEFTPEIEAECHKLAVGRVRLGFVVSEISRTEKIGVKSEEIREALALMIRVDPVQGMKLLQAYQKNEGNLGAVVGPILENKVVETLLSRITPEEKKCTLAELIEVDEEKFEFFADDDSAKKVEAEKGKSAKTKEKVVETEPKAEKKESKSTKAKAEKAEKAGNAEKSEKKETKTKKASTKKSDKKEEDAGTAKTSKKKVAKKAE